MISLVSEYTNKIIAGGKSFLFPGANAQTGTPNLSDAFGSVLTDTAKDAGYTSASSADITLMAGDIISIILTLLGTIFLALILYSGIKWMNSGGNEQSIEKAKSTLRQAIIGLIIVVGAYSLSYYLIKFLTK